MHTVNMPEARSSLSRLVEAIEQGTEREIIIARNGRPAAKLVSMGLPDSDLRIGVAKGAFKVADDIDVCNDDVAKLFLGATSCICSSIPMWHCGPLLTILSFRPTRVSYF
ncbi:type II toxin-antitoxin system Phd/YefM family antitoxin [Glaciimonas sp. GG7]